MASTPTLSAPTIHPPARTPPARAAARSRLLAALAVLVVLVAAGWGATRLGWFDGLLAVRAASSSVYVVKPLDLAITLSETGELKPLNSVEVICQVEGQSTIRTVVAESTIVKKGDLLVELASDALTDRFEEATLEARRAQLEHEAAIQDLKITRSRNASEISAAEIAVTVKELELRQYTEGESKKAMKAAEIDIEQTLMDIKQKEVELEKHRGMLEKGFVTKAKIDELEFALKKSRMELDKNQLAKQILEDFDNPKNLTQKQSDLQQAKDELERVRQQAQSQETAAVEMVNERASRVETTQRRLERAQRALAQARIVAPADGIVKYPGEEGGMRFGGDQRIAPGQKVFEGQVLISLPDTSKMAVSTRVHEADRHKIREGLKCLIRIPAVPDEVFTGTLGKIAQFADSAHRWFNPELKEHTTQILLDDTSAPVSPGDSAQIEILIETVPNALAVPVQCVFARGTKSYVFVRQGGRPALREVRTGRASTTFVEIVNGVSAGDAVYMHATEDMLALLPTVDDTAGGADKTAQAIQRAGRSTVKRDAGAAATPAAAAPAGSSASGESGN